jgi:hypothetical protein
MPRSVDMRCALRHPATISDQHTGGHQCHRPTIRALYPRRRCPLIWRPAPAVNLRALQGGEIVSSLVATVFGRATFVLPSCDGPFTRIV